MPLMVNGSIAAIRRASPLAIPLLGILAAIQGSAPNVSATALMAASRGLDMVGGSQALAASMQTLAIAAISLVASIVGSRPIVHARRGHTAHL